LNGPDADTRKGLFNFEDTVRFFLAWSRSGWQNPDSRSPANRIGTGFVFAPLSLRRSASQVFEPGLRARRPPPVDAGHL